MSVQSLTALFDLSLSLQIAWVMLHFIWQGFVIAAVVLVVNFFIRKSPTLRYGVAVAGMIAMLACVLATWLVLQPPSSNIDAYGLAAHTAATQPGFEFTSTSNAVTESTPTTPISILEAWAPTATLVYLVGVTLMLLRVVFSAIGIGRLRFASHTAGNALVLRVEELSKAIGLRMSPTLKTCERVVVPFVAGVVKPTILLPASIASGLTRAELDAILLHELAHIRRGDLFINLFQRMTESLLFFHPAVWYVSRAITAERENCCDDIVLGHCSQKVYASALIRLAEVFTNNSNDIAPIAAIAATGANPSQLKRRVMRILGVSPVRQFNRPSFTILCLCGLVVAATAVHLNAETKKDKQAPLTISFDNAGNAIGFTMNETGDDAMRRFTTILNQLTNDNQAEIDSMKIVNRSGGMTMKVTGQNFDFASIMNIVKSIDETQLSDLQDRRVDGTNEQLKPSAKGDEEPLTSGDVTMLLAIDEIEFEIADLEAAISEFDANIASGRESSVSPTLVQSQIDTLPEVKAIRSRIRHAEEKLVHIEAIAKEGKESSVYVKAAEGIAALKKELGALRTSLETATHAELVRHEAKQIEFDLQWKRAELERKRALLRKFRERVNDSDFRELHEAFRRERDTTRRDLEEEMDRWVVQALSECRGEEANLADRFGPEHPKRKRLRKVIQGLEERILESAKAEEHSPESSTSTGISPSHTKMIDKNVSMSPQAQGQLQDEAKVKAIRQRLIAKENEDPPIANPDAEEWALIAEQQKRVNKIIENSLKSGGPHRNPALPVKRKEDEVKASSAKPNQNITGPVRFEIFADNAYLIRGKKEDVQRVMNAIEKVRDADQPSPAEAAIGMSSYRKPHVTGPVAIEFLEGTDVYIVRGKKEDVDRVKATLGNLEASEAASPENKKTSRIPVLRDLNGRLVTDDRPDPVDPLTLVSYRLKHTTAESCAKTLTFIYPNDVELRTSTDVKNNRVLVRATQKMHNRIARIVQSIDQLQKKTAVPKQSRVFRIRGDAEPILKMVERMFGDDVGLSVMEVDSDDKSMNSILVVGTKEHVSQIAKLLLTIGSLVEKKPHAPKERDDGEEAPKAITPAEPGAKEAASNVRSKSLSLADYDLDGLTPQAVVEMLERTFRSQSPFVGEETTGSFSPAFLANEATNSVNVTGSADDVQRIELILEQIERLSSKKESQASADNGKQVESVVKLRSVSDPQRIASNAARKRALKDAKGKLANVRVFPLKEIAPGTTFKMLKSMFGGLKTSGIDFTIDAPTKSLIVRAPKDAMQQIEVLLKQIDHGGNNFFGARPTDSLRQSLSRGYPDLRDSPFLFQQTKQKTKAPFHFPVDVEKAMMLDSIESLPSIRVR